MSDLTRSVAFSPSDIRSSPSSHPGITSPTPILRKYHPKVLNGVLHIKGFCLEYEESKGFWSFLLDITVPE